MPWYVYPTWLLQDIVTPATCLVVVGYWLGKVFQPGDCSDMSSPKAVSVQTHGVNLFVMLLDAFINQQPVVLLHSFYFMLYVLAYSIFLACYNIISGRRLYGIIAWQESPTTGVLATAALVLLACPLLELALWHWWHLQSANAKGCYTRPEEVGLRDLGDGRAAAEEASTGHSFLIEFAVKNIDFSTNTSKGRLDYVKAFGESGLPGLREHRRLFLAARAGLFALMCSVLAQSVKGWGEYQRGAGCFAESAANATAKCSSCEPYWGYLTHWTLMIEIVYLGFACLTTYKLMAVARSRKAPQLVTVGSTVGNPVTQPVLSPRLFSPTVLTGGSAPSADPMAEYYSRSTNGSANDGAIADSTDPQNGVHTDIANGAGPKTTQF